MSEAGRQGLVRIQRRAQAADIGRYRFFRQPVEALKKSEFTQEADCFEAVKAQQWATRAFVINQTGCEQGYLSLQQIKTN